MSKKYPPVSLRGFILALCLFALCFSLPSSAQSLHYSSYTQRDGLADDYVTSIAFEPNTGAAWTGTANGASRIDGKYWTAYTSANGLGNSWVNGIVASPDGKIYFATYGGGLSIFDGPNRRTYDLSNSKIPGNYLTAIGVDTQHRVWVGTFGAGVGRFDGTLWNRYSLADNYINALALDANNNPWVATNAGAFYFNGSAWARLTQDNGLASSRVNTVAVAPDGRVWFGTDFGATVFDGKGFKSYRERDGLVNDSVRLFAFEPGGLVWIGTGRGVSVFDGINWTAQTRTDGLADNLIDAIAFDPRGNPWIGTPHGLSVTGPTLTKPVTYPVVLVHGWHGPDSDQLDDSEFRFLKKYLEADGISSFYAAGISPNRTLLQNAQILRDDIAGAKKVTGASKVDLIAFSMGGLNARAYLESSLYADDVRRVIILGTPEAGVRLWYPILTREIEDRPTEPSTIELSPEYAALFNSTHFPRASVPYDLLAGDARNQTGADLLKIFPPTDGLIDAWSAHALDAPNVRKISDTDLHAWNPTAEFFEPTSFLYPAQTYERFIRNALRDPDLRPMGVAAPHLEPIQPRNITPMNVDGLAAGQTITRAITIDANRAARFFTRWDRGDVNVELRAPDGTRYTPTNFRDATYLKADIGSFIGYAIPHALPGIWKLLASRTDQGQDVLRLTSYADLDADLQFAAVSDQPWYAANAPITLNATLSNRAGGADVRASVQWLGDGVTARGQSLVFRFDDKGGGNYQTLLSQGPGTSNLSKSGYYLARITAHANGFDRERELLFGISPNTAKLEGTPRARVEGAAGNYSALIIETEVNAARPGDFAVGVTLRAGDQVIASVTAAAALKSGTQTVSVSIPGRDIRARGLNAPYTIDLVLMDASWVAAPIETRVQGLTINEYRANDFGG